MDTHSAAPTRDGLRSSREPDRAGRRTGRTTRRALVAALVAVMATLPAACSTLSTEAEGPVIIDELGQGVQDEAVDVEIEGPASVTYRKITIEPGGGTGEHCHYGQLIAVVAEGTFTHYAPIYPEGVHVYEAGESIIEGSSYIHEGRNEGTEDVVLWVTYVTPEGKPLAETVLTNCDR